MAAPARGGRLDGMDQHTATSSAATTPGPGAFSAGPADPGRASVSVDAGPSGPPPRFTLRRSRTDRMLGGVCGGLAESLDADPALLRVLLVALTLITGGAAAVVYLAAWALAPADDRPAV
jgi:phage shock protein C